MLFRSDLQRLSPRFIRYLARLGVHWCKYATLRVLRIEEKQVEFRNREGIREFDFTMPNLSDRDGMAAIIRARNEEDKIGYCLASIYDVFDQIVVVDNNSTDETVALVQDFKARHDAANKISLHSYPFDLAKWGDENAAMPEDSVRSIVYFTNYALSLCRVKTLCCWDADMVLIPEQKARVAEFFRRLGRGTWTRWGIYGQTIYRGLDDDFYTSPRDVDRETRILPFSYHNRFFNAGVFEAITSPLYRRVFEEPIFYEMKFCSADEHINWAVGVDGKEGARTVSPRLAKDFEILGRLRSRQPLDADYASLGKGFLDRILGVHCGGQPCICTHEAMDSAANPVCRSQDIT